MNQITDTTEQLSFEDRKKEKTANDRPVRLTPVPQSKETIWKHLGEKNGSQSTQFCLEHVMMAHSNLLL